jgi:hypothetical protein
MRPEGLCEWKIQVTPLGIDPVTFQFVTQCLNHCVTACPNWAFTFLYMVQVVIKTTKSWNVQTQRGCLPNFGVVWTDLQIEFKYQQDRSVFYHVHFIDRDYFSCYSGTPLTQLVNVCCKHYWRLTINIIHASTFCVVKWKWIRWVCINRPCTSITSRNV